MKVVIVGGVAGGATAAARIRRLDEQAEIVVFERSGYISYANCGLPYYIGDVMMVYKPIPEVLYQILIMPVLTVLVRLDQFLLIIVPEKKVLKRFAWMML